MSTAAMVWVRTPDMRKERSVRLQVLGPAVGVRPVVSDVLKTALDVFPFSKTTTTLSDLVAFLDRGDAILALADALDNRALVDSLSSHEFVVCVRPSTTVPQPARTGVASAADSSTASNSFYHSPALQADERRSRGGDCRIVSPPRPSLRPAAYSTSPREPIHDATASSSLPLSPVGLYRAGAVTALELSHWQDVVRHSPSLHQRVPRMDHQDPRLAMAPTVAQPSVASFATVIAYANRYRTFERATSRRPLTPPREAPSSRLHATPPSRRGAVTPRRTPPPNHSARVDVRPDTNHAIASRSNYNHSPRQHMVQLSVPETPAQYPIQQDQHMPSLNQDEPPPLEARSRRAPHEPWYDEGAPHTMRLITPMITEESLFVGHFAEATNHQRHLVAEPSPRRANNNNKSPHRVRFAPDVPDAALPLKLRERQSTAVTRCLSVHTIRILVALFIESLGDLLALAAVCRELRDCYLPLTLDVAERVLRCDATLKALRRISSEAFFSAVCGAAEGPAASVSIDGAGVMDVNTFRLLKVVAELASGNPCLDVRSCRAVLVGFGNATSYSRLVSSLARLAEVEATNPGSSISEQQQFAMTSIIGRVDAPALPLALQPFMVFVSQLLRTGTCNQWEIAERRIAERVKQLWGSN